MSFQSYILLNYAAGRLIILVSRLKEDGFSYEELLQAKSALRFLFDKVLVTQPGIADRYSSDDNSDNPGSFRITA